MTITNNAESDSKSDSSSASYDDDSEDSRSYSSSDFVDDSSSSTSSSSLKEKNQSLRPQKRKAGILQIPFLASFVRRRKQPCSKPPSRDDDYAPDDGHRVMTEKHRNNRNISLSRSGSPSKRYKVSRRRGTFHELFKRHKRRGWHWSSYLLLNSLIAWSCIQFMCYRNAPSTEQTLEHTSLRAAMKKGRPPKQPLHHDNLYPNNPNALPQHQHKKPNVEELPPGCEYAKWQQERGSKLLHCNALHELDLTLLLRHSFGNARKWRHQQRLADDATRNSTDSSDTSTDRSSPGKYLSSGLWRDVWSLQLDPDFLHVNSSNAGKAVLKMMKMEHDLVERNFERHRREAITMERLSSSPHVVDLFAYCGNTILTEFAPQDLSTAIKGDQESKKRRKGPRKGLKVPENLADGKGDALTGKIKEMEGDDNTAHHLPPIQRLKLALQAAKGVQALHRNDIMHADLTAKQFLVTESCDNRDEYCTMQLKINDFNRCRFIPHKSPNTTKEGLFETCSVRIPSAPGLYRSPEEYAAQNLNAQIDVFSLGNVLVELWTGKEPWDDVGGKLVRKHVQEGHLPSALVNIIKNGEKDANDTLHRMNSSVAKLIARCYDVNPQQRISADNLVKELEQLVQRAERQAVT